MLHQHIFRSRDRYTAQRTADRLLTKYWKTTHNIVSLVRQEAWVWRLEIEEVEKKELKLLPNLDYLVS